MPKANYLLLRQITVASSVLLALCFYASSQQSASSSARKPNGQASKHNVLLFITDGLRHDAVNQTDSPTIFRLREQGINFVNSHALFPTVTTANASAFATGHQLGDTGDFSNTVLVPEPLSGGQACSDKAYVIVPFLENDVILSDLNRHLGGNYLGEETLVAIARQNGYTTASVGKIGPTAIQDVSELKCAESEAAHSGVVIIDDKTGYPEGIQLPSSMEQALKTLGLSKAPDRSNGAPGTTMDNGANGGGGKPKTLSANLDQQRYLVRVLTKWVLPEAQKKGAPFLLVFWSLDPDGTQHNQGDSPDALDPGINGPSSRAAIRNADNDLWELLEYLRANHLEENTDVIVVADHGFSTISKGPLNRDGTIQAAGFSASRHKDASGHVNLPVGFLAMDLADGLHKLNESLALYDPDKLDPNDLTKYAAVTLDNSATLTFGNAILGGSGKVPAGESVLSTDARVVVAANGGSDLIYLLRKDPVLLSKICKFLVAQNYVDGVFVHDDDGQLPGTLPMSSIGLMGSTAMPVPTIVVNFKSFSYISASPLLSRIEIADSTLAQGQGMHGSFSRADTYNNMVAYGPDFKQGYVDHAPASNADVAVTIAHVLGWSLPSHGKLVGRVLHEALREAPELRPAAKLVEVSPASADGHRTVLEYQLFDGHKYYDRACMVHDNSPSGHPTGSPHCE
jgi:arylsulfatase A-like enzyme